MSGMLCAHVAVLAVLTPSSGSSVSRVLSGLRRPVDVHDGVHHDHGVTISRFVSMVVIRQNLQSCAAGTANSAVPPARRDRNGGSVTRPSRCHCSPNVKRTHARVVSQFEL